MNISNRRMLSVALLVGFASIFGYLSLSPEDSIDVSGLERAPLEGAEDQEVQSEASLPSVARQELAVPNPASSKREAGGPDLGTALLEIDGPEGYPFKIIGSVHWPDGSPATSMQIRQLGVLEDEGMSMLMNSLLDEEPRDVAFWSPRVGHFGIATMTPEDIGVSVWAKREPAGTDGDSPGPDQIAFARVEALSMTAKSPRIELQPGGIASGRVVDESGDAVLSFTLRAVPAGSDGDHQLEVLEQEFKSEDGSFELANLGPYRYLLCAHIEGGAATQVVHILTTPRTGLLLIAPSAARVEGVVVNGAGQPVPKAALRLTSSAPPSNPDADNEFLPGNSDFTTSDAQGAFAFEGLQALTSSIEVRARGYAPFTMEGVELLGGETLTGLRIELVEGARLTGELHPGLDAPGARRVSMQIEPSGLQLSGAVDATGRFEMGDLPAGDIVLWTHRIPWSEDLVDPSADVNEDRRTREVFQSQIEFVRVAATLRPGQTTHVVLGEYFDPGVRVFGSITDRGLPVHDLMLGVQLAAEEDRNGYAILGRTDASGVYGIPVADPGLYELVAMDDWEKQVLAQFELKSDPEFLELNISLPSASLSGQVTGPNGPLPNTCIRIWGNCPQPLGSFFREMTCDEDGRFEARRLPAGSYMIGAWQATGSEVLDNLAYTFSDRIPLKAMGKVQNIHLEIRQGGTIEGVVLTKEGTVLEGASIWVRDAADANLTNRLETDAFGKFTTGSIRPGIVRIFAFHNEKPSKLVEATLEAGGRLQVELKF